MDQLNFGSWFFAEQCRPLKTQFVLWLLPFSTESCLRAREPPAPAEVWKRCSLSPSSGPGCSQRPIVLRCLGKSGKSSPAQEPHAVFCCICLRASTPWFNFFLIGSCCVVWIFKQLLTEWQLTDCIDRFSFENPWNWVQFAKLSRHSNDNEFWFPGTDIRLLIKLCASAFNLLQIIGKCNEAFQLKHGFMLFNNTPIIL